MCKIRNKIFSMLLLCCLMLSALMPLSTNIASAASDGNNQEVIMNEDGVPTTYKVGGIDYELVKGEFNYTSAEYEEMSSYFYYSDGYFAQSPEYYNEHFASFAASMALASMPCCYEGEYSEENSTKYIVNMFNASSADREIGVFQHVAPPTRLRLEFSRETGLILRRAGKSGNPFQTKQGNRPYFRDQEERKGSDEVVPGTSVLSLSESRVTFLVASRVPSTVSHFKTEPGTSLEML